MLRLNHFRGFALLNGFDSQESSLVKFLSYTHDYTVECLSASDCVPKDLVPVGSVEWVSSLLDDVEPDYYPDWVSDHLHRRVWRGDEWAGAGVFVKPADAYKRFTGYVVTESSKREPGPYWFSDVVSFTNEWRYYISCGQVMTARWYDGDELLTPDPPELEIEIPKHVCCAADFGMLSTGELACVEVQHPFACGWYGSTSKDGLAYLQWLIDGWDYMSQWRT